MVEVLPKDSFQSRMQSLIELAGSQDKLGLLCGLSGVMIGKYAAGKAEPARDKLVAIANKSGVSVEWLATGNGPKRREGHVANGNNIIQGAHIDAEDVHLMVQQPGITADPGVAYVDPIDARFLSDWKRLSEAGMMRVWTMLKEEIEREKEKREG